MANSLSDLIAGLKNRAVDAGNSLAQAASDQWDQGSPYRIAAGALMSGDPQTANDVLSQRFANTTPGDVMNGAVGAGVGFAPVGFTMGASNFGANIGDRINPTGRAAYQSAQDGIGQIEQATKEHYDVAQDLFNRGFRVGTDGQIHRPTSYDW